MQNLVMSRWVINVVVKLIAMLWPTIIPQMGNIAGGNRRHGVFSVPILEGLLQHVEDLFLQWKDLVLQRAVGNRGQGFVVKIQSIIIGGDVVGLCGWCSQVRS